MLRTRPHQHLAATLATVALAANPTAEATSYYCAPLPVRVMRADAVVAGRTIATGRREYRPGRFVSIYRFRVERVIKGDAYAVGDEIIEETRTGFIPEGPHLPPPEWGFQVAFMQRGRDDVPRSSPCGVAADEPTLRKLERIVIVAASPHEYLQSDDELDVETILHWVQQRQRLVVPNAAGGRVAGLDAPAPLDAATAIRYALKQADRRDGAVYALTIAVLAGFHTPETFDALAAALDSTDAWVINRAAEGLRELGDPRAVPLLLDRLHRLGASRHVLVEQTETAWRDDGTSYERKVMKPDPMYERSGGQVIRALEYFDDPRIADAILADLDGPLFEAALTVLQKTGDTRAVAAVLQRAWEGSQTAAVGLGHFDDPIIGQAARRRMFDHPFAPIVLAAIGDSQSAEFMRRLIRQGHRDGARWAAATADEASAGVLREALLRAPAQAGYDIATALGRLRAFEAMDALSRDDDDMLALARRVSFLGGLIEGHEVRKALRSEDAFAFVRQRLESIAERETWSADCRQQAARFIDGVETQVMEQRRQLDAAVPRGDVWTPPSVLPDMPDPLDARRAVPYLSEYRDRCRELLPSCSTDDKLMILQAYDIAELRLLDGDLAVRLSLARSQLVQGRVANLMRRDAVTLTPAQLERWVSTGSYETTWRALTYVHENPRREYAPAVATVFREGWHLFDENLFKAIITTRATQCADELRGYLDGQHIDLRRNAAVTLAHFDDTAGLDVLVQEWERLRSCPNCTPASYVREALHLLGQPAD